MVDDSFLGDGSFSKPTNYVGPAAFLDGKLLNELELLEEVLVDPGGIWEIRVISREN